MGPTWGPPGSCRPQMGPMYLALRDYISQHISAYKREIQRKWKYRNVDIFATDCTGNCQLQLPMQPLTKLSSIWWHIQFIFSFMFALGHFRGSSRLVGWSPIGHRNISEKWTETEWVSEWVSVSEGGRERGREWRREGGSEGVSELKYDSQWTLSMEKWLILEYYFRTDFCI